MSYPCDHKFIGTLSTREARAAIGKIVGVTDPDTSGLSGATSCA